jgi:LAO/AO transport system kinase
VRATARGISIIEDDPDAGAALMRDLFPHSGRALLVGMTGAPGAGKSTLVDGLVSRWRRAGRTVGVIAVDPTSPYTGGAVLGDRIRMQAHANDPGVFIRSMATRGRLGGLARATADAASLLDASGKDIVLVETVGVGQGEIEVVRTVDVAIVVLVPGMGDEVQVLKAGIMEIGDIFVVNKADRDGADRTVSEIESLLSLRPYQEGEWKPRIVRTQATTGEGVDRLMEAIDDFRSHSTDVLASRRRVRAGAQLRMILSDRLMRRVETHVGSVDIEELIDRVTERRTDPYTAADALMDRAGGGG